MARKVDLTTKEGILLAFRSLEPFDRALLRSSPILFAGKKAAERIADMFATNESTIEVQRKVALDLIRAGKRDGVDSMEITLDQEAGVSLRGGVDGIPLKMVAGKAGHMTIKVTYKDD